MRHISDEHKKEIKNCLHAVASRDLSSFPLHLPYTEHLIRTTELFCQRYTSSIFCVLLVETTEGGSWLSDISLLGIGRAGFRTVGAK